MAQMKNWPKTSDREFSKRMFIIFMWAFFIHIVLTIMAEWLFEVQGKAVEVFKLCIPVYSTIFAAVIVKGGVENVFKGLGNNGAVTLISNAESSNG